MLNQADTGIAGEGAFNAEELKVQRPWRRKGLETQGTEKRPM
jgi:hypothetical protein